MYVTRILFLVELLSWFFVEEGTGKKMCFGAAGVSLLISWNVFLSSPTLHSRHSILTTSTVLFLRRGFRGICCRKKGDVVVALSRR